MTTLPDPSIRCFRKSSEYSKAKMSWHGPVNEPMPTLCRRAEMDHSRTYHDAPFPSLWSRHAARCPHRCPGRGPGALLRDGLRLAKELRHAAIHAFLGGLCPLVRAVPRERGTRLHHHQLAVGAHGGRH